MFVPFAIGARSFRVKIIKSYHNMKRGIVKITERREEHFTKHKIEIIDDAINNKDYQLSFAAAALSCPFPEAMGMSIENGYSCPIGWNLKVWTKMMHKPYSERLEIAGSLLAAEIDRLQFEE